MRLFTVIPIILLSSLASPARGADTNVLIIPKGEDRPGAVYFVDECLTRGLSNSISISNLQEWATNTIRVYQEREARPVNTRTVRNTAILEADIPTAIRTMQTRIPACRSTKPMPIEGWNKFVESMSKVWAVSEEEAEARLRTIAPDPSPPRVRLWRSAGGDIEALSISWRIYGIIVGPESFAPKWEHDPWYHRKLTNGIYLWHGYD